MKQFLGFALVAGLLMGCDAPSSEPLSEAPVNETVQQILSAATPGEALAFGARELSGDDFRLELVGRTLSDETGGRWTWNINPDGTSNSRADDGSWETSSVWQISNNQYCRVTEGDPRKCSSVYELAGIYRFSEPDGTLAGWAVTVK